MNLMIELNEVKQTGLLWWSKTKVEVVFINLDHIESFYNRKRQGTTIETNGRIYHVRESISEVVDLAKDAYRQREHILNNN